MNVAPQEVILFCGGWPDSTCFPNNEEKRGLLQFWLRAPSLGLFWGVVLFFRHLQSCFCLLLYCRYSLQGPVSKSSSAKEKLAYVETSALLLFLLPSNSPPVSVMLPLYSFPRAAATKCHRLRGLNNRNLFSQRSGSQNSEIKVPARLPFWDYGGICSRALPWLLVVWWQCLRFLGLYEHEHRSDLCLNVSWLSPYVGLSQNFHSFPSHFGLELTLMAWF